MASDDNQPNASKTPTDSPAESNLPKRRERLEALMARRESLAAEPDEAPAAAPQQRPAGGNWQGMGGGGGAGGGAGGRRFGGGQPGGMMQRRGGMGGGMQGGGMRGPMQGRGMQGGGMQGGGMQRKIAARIMRLLTQTPADDRGFVPGTPFTQTGVGELMRLIGERASADGAPGAKAATAIIRFLSASPEDGEQIEGASVQKLQMLARRLQGGGSL